MYLSVGNIANSVEGVVVGNLEHARLEALVGEYVDVARVGHAYSIDDEVVGIYVGCGGGDSHAPHALVVA